MSGFEDAAVKSYKKLRKTITPVITLQNLPHYVFKVGSRCGKNNKNAITTSTMLIPWDVS